MSGKMQPREIYEALRGASRLDHLRADYTGSEITLTLVGYGTGTWNPADLADGAGETSSGITVTGAAVGDFVLVAPPYDLQDLLCSGYVQAANTVEIRIQNENAGANVNLASGDWKVVVLRIA